MKTILSLIAGLVIVGQLNAQTTVSTTSTASWINQLATNTAIRINNATTGADYATAQQIYDNNYNNAGYWSSYWSKTTTSATAADWLDQIRVLDVVCSNSVIHLQQSMLWFASLGEFPTTDGKPISITSQNTSTWNHPEYTVTAILNGVTYTGVAGTLGEALADAQAQLYPAWWHQVSLIDPSGNLLTANDYNIINDSINNSSQYQLAHAGRGNSADSTLLSLLVGEAAATSTINTISNQVATNAIAPITTSVDTTAGATFDQIYATMIASGAVVRPDAVTQPSDAVDAIRQIYARAYQYNNSGLNPSDIRDQLLDFAYADLMRGGWNGNKFTFSRPIQHSAQYLALYSRYQGVCNELIAYYQIISTALKGQLSQANSMDQTIATQVSTYYQQATNQAPIGSAVNTSQATQLYNNEVSPGNMSFPTIQIAEYLIWEIGPPWASTPGWTVGPDYIPNPLYYTIIAQYVRGLEDDAGISIQPQNVAENAMKAATQQLMAIADVGDREDKKSDLQNKNDQYANYGNKSQTVASQAMASSISTTPTYTNTDNAIVQSAMMGVNSSRANSTALAQQQQDFYNKMTGSGTLIERAALRNEQEVAKTAVLQDLSASQNNRRVMRALIRNEDMQATNDLKKLDSALGQGTLQ